MMTRSKILMVLSSFDSFVPASHSRPWAWPRVFKRQPWSLGWRQNAGLVAAYQNPSVTQYLPGKSLSVSSPGWLCRLLVPGAILWELSAPRAKAHPSRRQMFSKASIRLWNQLQSLGGNSHPPTPDAASKPRFSPRFNFRTQQPTR